MAESERPSKRRKTNSPEERERESSPLRKPPRRPSFASPTKASLARNYPNLLGTTAARSPAPRPNSRGDVMNRAKQARAFIMGETEESVAFSEGALENRNTRRATLEMEQPQTMAGVVPPRARKAMARRNQSPATGGALEEEESELPATPSSRGLEEQDGPRRGILFSSPSKRPPRARNPAKPSPLKRRALSAQDQRLGQPEEDTPAEADDSIKLAQKNQLPDSELERRKQERTQLQREMEELEADISRCAREIGDEQQRPPDQSFKAAERENLM